MNLHQKEDAEIVQVYETWLYSYLNGDVSTYNLFFDDDYRFIGSTNNEEFLSRQETVQFFEVTADQFAGKTELRNSVRTIKQINSLIFITHLFDAYFRNDAGWAYYGRFRFTSALRKKEEGWRFVYQHFSMPDSKAQEGETIGYEKVSAENLQLKDAIKRRTIELEHKNTELEIALQDLKSAQSQLIQSEKMASLGELTAGIAHEIQNPLNFVNNFSEVNAEMIEELKDHLSKGLHQEAINIAGDIGENERKIVHHGKRADAIVKGMLQHSRTSSGQTELTDINALADEYLRLAYHGLRAKDKSFNATLQTGYDDSIGMINIIPQDIGRVILNLITNAFYAVSERKNTESRLTSRNEFGTGSEGGNDISLKEGYEPTVTVTTRRLSLPSGGWGAELAVTDNGKGIPQHLLSKIFQPFFTTKPTGEGTGLGLSLSYDIVRAHGGQLSVETKEGQETVFIVQIPFS